MTEPLHLLAALADTSRLPVDLLREAEGMRHALVPLFIDHINRYLVAMPDERKQPSAVFFIFHLLGSWRETSAYPLLAEFLRSEPAALQRVLGDAVTLTSHRVMAAVFDGDQLPLQGVVLDPNADCLVRARMIEALAMATLRQQISRNDMAAFLRACFSALKPQDASPVWVGWQSAIAMLGLADLKLLVKQAFDRGFIDPKILTYQHFTDDLKKTLDGDNDASLHEYTPFGDVVEELSSWSSFQR